MGREAKKTPEQMAMIMDELKNQKEIQKKKDDIKKVKNGQIIIFVMCALLTLSGFVEYNDSGQDILVFYVYGPLVGIYLLLGFLYFKDPVLVPTIALVIYILLLVIIAMGDPTTIANGAIVKVLIITGLFRAIKYGKDYKVAKISLESDPLDQGLFDEVK